MFSYLLHVVLSSVMLNKDKRAGLFDVNFAVLPTTSSSCVCCCIHRTKWKRQTAVGLELLAEAGNYAAVQRMLQTNPYWATYDPHTVSLIANLDAILLRHQGSPAAAAGTGGTAPPPPVCPSSLGSPSAAAPHPLPVPAVAARMLMHQQQQQQHGTAAAAAAVSGGRVPACSPAAFSAAVAGRNESPRLQAIV